MENQLIIKIEKSLLESSILYADVLIKNYLESNIFDPSVKESLFKLIDDYEKLVPKLPYIFSGKLDGKNSKDNVLLTLHNLRIALHYCEEYPECFVSAWDEFLKYWLKFSTHFDLFLKDRRNIPFHLN